MKQFSNTAQNDNEEKALIDRISALNPSPVQCQNDASELEALAAECGIDASSFKFSSWNRWDLVVCTVAGSLGGLLPNIGTESNGLSTGRSSFVRQTGAHLHNAASQVQPADRSFLITVLGHKGDLADRIPEDVEALRIPKGMHRLFSGHDFLQLDPDKNVIGIFSKQYGIPIGIVRLLFHAFYDTFAMQGLPLPGSSNFADTIYIDWSGRSSKIYEQVFTLKMSDVTGAGLAAGLLWAYRKMDQRLWTKRPMKKDYRYYQMNMLTYALVAGIGALAGSLNWPALALLINNYVGMLRFQSRQTALIANEIEDLRQQTSTLSAGPSIDARIAKLDKDLENELREE